MENIIQLTPKKQLLARWLALQNERNSWFVHWRDLSSYVHPRSGRFLSQNRNRGTKQHSNIINNTGTRAAGILASGMMAGITSPARSWFRLDTPDPALAEVTSVRIWLSQVEDRIRAAFLKSNIYNCLHSVYRDLGTPGTAAMLVEEDAKDVLRGYVFPIGQYCLATSPRQEVDTVFRELGMTTRQTVEAFGFEVCSPAVQQNYRNGKLDEWVEILHVIEPNASYQGDKLGPTGKKWRSCWLEMTGQGDGFLRESGFDEFPVMAPRWETTGEDVYGSSPGMEALGDIRALQTLEKRAAQAFDKSVNPPMRAPAELQNMPSSLIPGDVTFMPANATGQKFEPAMEINPAALQAFEVKIANHERRIKAAYFADLWLMLSQQDGTMTATEVVERQQEKMLQLGPVMERLQGELLDPLINRTFGILLRRGLIPPPPLELQGKELRVEYISIMAQAQKLLGTTAVERLTSFVANVSKVQPSVLDKLDVDQVVDEYSLMLSVPPSLVRSDDDVASLRASRAQAAQQQQQLEQAQQAAQTSKTLADTNLENDNALSRMLGNVGIPGPVRQ